MRCPSAVATRRRGCFVDCRVVPVPNAGNQVDQPRHRSQPRAGALATQPAVSSLRKGSGLELSADEHSDCRVSHVPAFRSAPCKLVSAQQCNHDRGPKVGIPEQSLSWYPRQRSLRNRLAQAMLEVRYRMTTSEDPASSPTRSELLRTPPEYSEIDQHASLSEAYEVA
jgi:hypothetical protein